MIRPRLRLVVLLCGGALEPAHAQELLLADSWGGEVGSIFHFTAAGEWLGVVPPTHHTVNPGGLAFDMDGNLYVTDRLAGVIHRYAPGATTPTIFASTGLNLPTALAFNSQGELIVGNYGDGSLSVFSATGSLVRTLTTGLLGPVALAVDAADAIYVSAPSVGNDAGVFRFAPDGSGRTQLITGRELDARGLAFDRAGNLYVADQLNQTVQRFNCDGQYWETFDTGLAEPFALAFNSEGDLFVANQWQGTVRRYTSDGLDLGHFICLPGRDHNLVGLVFTPVPEPAVAVLAMLSAVWCCRRSGSPQA